MDENLEKEMGMKKYGEREGEARRFAGLLPGDYAISKKHRGCTSILFIWVANKKGGTKKKLVHAGSAPFLYTLLAQAY